MIQFERIVMKLLIVSNMYPSKKHPSYGIFVKNFCNQLPKINVKYETVVMHKGSSKVDKTIKYVWFYTSSFLKCLFKHYDIVYVHYASHSSLGVLLARKIKKFTLFTNLHGSDVVPENAGQERMQKYTRAVLMKSRRVIVPSEYFKELVAKKYLIDDKKIYVYPSGGIDKKIFYKADEKSISELKSELGVNSKLMTFGIVGRISHNKGWDVFVEAIKFVTEKGYDANFVIIGDGPEAVLLERKIQTLELLKKIIFVKRLIPQKELAIYYSLFDWFIFPTKREGESLGLVAIESMACGTPVIASDFAAPRYYVQDEVNGYKFEMGNANALADRLIQIMENKEGKIRFEEGIRETVEGYFDDAVRNMLKDIFSYEE